jgi:hypothetical protein
VASFKDFSSLECQESAVAISMPGYLCFCGMGLGPVWPVVYVKVVFIHFGWGVGLRPILSVKIKEDVNIFSCFNSLNTVPSIFVFKATSIKKHNSVFPSFE